MNRKELLPFIPQRIVKANSQTLEAIYLHFVDGYTVQEAADTAGITRQCAGQSIYPIRDALAEAGFVLETVTKLAYVKKG